jgi:hypothetical protein
MSARRAHTGKVRRRLNTRVLNHRDQCLVRAVLIAN